MPTVTSRAVRLVTALTCVAVALSPSHAVAAPCWPPPVDAPVVDPFREPACPWCPGNRGIEYGTAAGADVVAVAAGTVTYAGAIAGVGYVVVRHADDRRATYGNLAERHVRRGDVVVAGSVVGVSAGHVHFGLRDGDRYIDPSPMLGSWWRTPRLIPVDGSAAAPAGPARLRCSVTEHSSPNPRRRVAWTPVATGGLADSISGRFIVR